MVREILKFVRQLARSAEEAPDTMYRTGYLDALRETEEFVTDLVWEENGADYDDQ